MADAPGLARPAPGATSRRSPAARCGYRVYAGTDPVTCKRHTLIETVGPGPKAWREAERVRDRLVAQVAEKR